VVRSSRSGIASAARPPPRRGTGRPATPAAQRQLDLGPDRGADHLPPPAPGRPGRPPRRAPAGPCGGRRGPATSSSHHLPPWKCGTSPHAARSRTSTSPSPSGRRARRTPGLDPEPSRAAPGQGARIAVGEAVCAERRIRHACATSTGRTGSPRARSAQRRARASAGRGRARSSDRSRSRRPRPPRSGWRERDQTRSRDNGTSSGERRRSKRGRISSE
jgi:hypothetical protein